MTKHMNHIPAISLEYPGRYPGKSYVITIICSFYVMWNPTLMPRMMTVCNIFNYKVISSKLGSIDIGLCDHIPTSPANYTCFADQ